MKNLAAVIINIFRWILGLSGVGIQLFMYVYTIWGAYKMFADSALAAIIAGCLPVISTIGMFVLQWLKFGFVGFPSAICILVVLFIVIMAIVYALSLAINKIKGEE